MYKANIFLILPAMMLDNIRGKGHCNTEPKRKFHNKYELEWIKLNTKSSEWFKEILLRDISSL